MKKTLISAIVLSIITASSILFIVMNNILLVCIIAQGFNVPSKSHYFFLDRAIKLTERESNCDRLINLLYEDNHNHLHSMFIHILGLKGASAVDQNLIGFLIKSPSEDSTIINATIKAIGQTGEKKYLPNLIKKINDKNGNPYERYLTTKSYYIITGENFYFERGEKKEINIEQNFYKIRELVLSSAGRKRTYEEMIELDRLSRPPSYR